MASTNAPILKGRAKPRRVISSSITQALRHRRSLQELEDVLHHGAGRSGGLDQPLVPYHFTLVQNIKRDPFEQAVGSDQKTAMSSGWCAWRSCDWVSNTIGTCCLSGNNSGKRNCFPTRSIPPLQAPETYNLDGILKQIQKARTNGRLRRADWDDVVQRGRPTERAPARFLSRPAQVSPIGCLEPRPD